jgi:hypothetical protein
MDQTLTSAARERSPSFTKAAFGFLGSLTVIILAMLAAGSLGA